MSGAPSPLQAMISPDGKVGDVPVDRVNDAVAAGFKMGVDMIAPDGTAGVIPVDKAHDALGQGFKLNNPVGQAGAQNMQESAAPKVARAVTGALPAAGAAAGATLAAPGVVSTPVGAGLGAAAGTEAKQLANRAMFGNDEPATTSKTGLREAATQGVAAAASTAAMEGLQALSGKALDALSTIARGERAAEPAGEQALRGAANLAASEGSTATPSLRESLTDPIEESQANYKSLYKQIDEASGVDVKALREKLANTLQDLRELTDTEEDVAKEAKLEKARTGLMDKITQAEQDAVANGVSPDTLKNADKAFQQTQALKDVEAKVFKNPNIVVGNTKFGTNETVNVNGAVKAIQKLQDNAKYGGPRLEQAFGKDGAQTLLNNLYAAQRAGQKAVKVQQVAKWILGVGGTAAVYEGARQVLAH